jgi:1,4-dihydroxy-6-naphthoate synthase
MSFERIMDAVSEKRVDGGIIIHESRFTYQQHGLFCRQDLGSWWEDVTGYPIPLGGIVARRSLGREQILQIEECIRASVRLAFQLPEKCQAYIKKYAQELDDQVIYDHIRLYVNHFTEDLGENGIEAVREFIKRGVRAGLFNRSSQKIVEEK